jgi:hypothetical protein
MASPRDSPCRQRRRARARAPGPRKQGGPSSAADREERDQRRHRARQQANRAAAPRRPDRNGTGGPALTSPRPVVLPKASERRPGTGAGGRRYRFQSGIV